MKRNQSEGGATRHPVAKDFDDPVVRELSGPSLADLWSKEAYEQFGPPRDTPYDVALAFNEREIPLVLDVGCGAGAFAEAYTGTWIGLDKSIEQLRKTAGRRVLSDALTLPFADSVFPGVTALYVLYFFDDPLEAVAEARRVLQAGGLFGVCAPSRYDCPELHDVLPREAFDESFASEDIPDAMASFEDVVITTWDTPMFDLLDRETIRDYLYAHYYPLFTADEAEVAASRVPAPMKLTKKGAWAVGRKPD